MHCGGGLQRGIRIRKGMASRDVYLQHLNNPVMLHSLGIRRKHLSPASAPPMTGICGYHCRIPPYVRGLVPGPRFELKLGTIMFLSLSSYPLRFPEWSRT